jgi:O-antigen/teichoic acid export membrane protein
VLILILLTIFFGGWFVCAFSGIFVLTVVGERHIIYGGFFKEQKEFGDFLIRISWPFLMATVITLIYAYKTI